jgi:hypothetical protein
MYPCLKIFEPDPRLTECPYCGIPLTKQVRAERSEIESEDGDLQTITPAMRAELEARIRTHSEKKAYYLDLVKLAVRRGYRPGFPFVKFVEKFGERPERGWKKEVEFVTGKLQVPTPPPLVWDETEVFA